jgi:uncharacterized membrane protein YhaH (DUF805 family)
MPHSFNVSNFFFAIVAQAAKQTVYQNGVIMKAFFVFVPFFVFCPLNSIATRRLHLIPTLLVCGWLVVFISSSSPLIYYALEINQ